MGTTVPEAVETTRTEVRPGLVMIKRRTIKEDGRYLLYFDFERAEAAAEESPKSE